MNIGIIGQGFVGNAVYQKFKNFYDIKTYDLEPSKSNSTEQEVFNCGIVFVCLPTPMSKDGSCYIGIVNNTLAALNANGKTKIAIIKSTIPPGSTTNWNMQHAVPLANIRGVSRVASVFADFCFSVSFASSCEVLSNICVCLRLNI